MIGNLAFVGLTGGIGSGKSTVARLIAAQGIPVVDADDLARRVVEPSEPAFRDLASLWPDVLTPDGHLDRARLAAKVFADQTARRQLEAITHPRIASLAHAQAEALAAAGQRIAVYEASLLVETGRHRRCDALVVVAASENTQMARLGQRGLSAAQARARIRAQLPLPEKMRAATYVIHNDGDMAALASEVDALVATLRSRFER